MQRLSRRLDEYLLTLVDISCSDRHLMRIAEVMHVQKSSARTYLARLIREGLVKQDGLRRYHLTEKGTEYLLPLIVGKEILFRWMHFRLGIPLPEAEQQARTLTACLSMESLRAIRRKDVEKEKVYNNIVMKKMKERRDEKETVQYRHRAGGDTADDRALSGTGAGRVHGLYGNQLL